MAQERLSLRKIREVLRLKHEVGLSNRAIARACRVSNSTVGEYVKRAEQAGLAWPLPGDLGEEELYRKLFPEGEAAKTAVRPQLGYGASGVGAQRGDIEASGADVASGGESLCRDQEKVNRKIKCNCAFHISSPRNQNACTCS